MLTDSQENHSIPECFQASVGFQVSQVAYCLIITAEEVGPLLPVVVIHITVAGSNMLKTATSLETTDAFPGYSLCKFFKLWMMFAQIHPA